MLTITENAVEALDAIVESAPISDDSGVRISRQMGEDGQAALGISLVEQPEATDQVLEIEGEHVPVFIEAEAAPELEDKVLDARVQDGQVGFIVAQQG